MSYSEILFAKLRPDAVIPTKRDEDAGFDIYPCFAEEEIRIEPGEVAMIPTGICSAFPKGLVVVLKERGSTGTKGIEQRSGVIDSGYRGEWLVPITNGSSQVLVITKKRHDSSTGVCLFYPYSKAICQALVLEVPECVSREVSVDEIQSIRSERGDGRLGSSGK